MPRYSIHTNLQGYARAEEGMGRLRVLICWTWKFFRDFTEASAAVIGFSAILFLYQHPLNALVLPASLLFQARTSDEARIRD